MEQEQKKYTFTEDEMFRFILASHVNLKADTSSPYLNLKNIVFLVNEFEKIDDQFVINNVFRFIKNDMLSTSYYDWFSDQAMRDAARLSSNRMSQAFVLLEFALCVAHTIFSRFDLEIVEKDISTFMARITKQSPTSSPDSTLQIITKRAKESAIKRVKIYKMENTLGGK